MRSVFIWVSIFFVVFNLSLASSWAIKISYVPPSEDKEFYEQLKELEEETNQVSTRTQKRLLVYSKKLINKRLKKIKRTVFNLMDYIGIGIVSKKKISEKEFQFVSIKYFPQKIAKTQMVSFSKKRGKEVCLAPTKECKDYVIEFYTNSEYLDFLKFLAAINDIDIITYADIMPTEDVEDIVDVIEENITECNSNEYLQCKRRLKKQLFRHTVLLVIRAFESNSGARRCKPITLPLGFKVEKLREQMFIAGEEVLESAINSSQALSSQAQVSGQTEEGGSEGGEGW